MIDRIKRGEDPVPRTPAPEPTVADLADRYVKAHLEVNCRPGTVETFGRVVRLYIVPELGHLRLSEVDRSHVSALHYGMRDKPYQANQTVSVLGKMFQLAEAWGMTAPRRNPCRSVRHYKEHRRERFLSPEEYRRLGQVLHEAAGDGSVFASAVPAIRLLLLTGCPQERDRHPALGRHRPHGGGAAASRFEDRGAAGAADAGGGMGARGDPVHRGQPLGHHRPEPG